MRLDKLAFETDLDVNWSITIFFSEGKKITGEIVQMDDMKYHVDGHMSRKIKLREQDGKYKGMHHEYLIHSSTFDTDLCPLI